MRQVLSSTPWVERTREFARAMRTSTRVDHGLLLVGTPEEEPWHLAAHLDDETRFAGIPQLSPVLVRYRIPEGAPAHLSVGLERLERASRGETVFIVAPGIAPESLLERAHDARRNGTTILSMNTGDSDLNSIAHESLIVPARGLVIPDTSTESFITSLESAYATTTLANDVSTLGATFDVIEHLVSTAVGESALTSPTHSSTQRRGVRDRLGRLLDSISGPSIAHD